jgi:hypothetical protein
MLTVTWAARCAAQHPALAYLAACTNCVPLSVCPCCPVCCCRLYEEVEPARILDERAAASGEGREFLVQYKVGAWEAWWLGVCSHSMYC